MKKFFTQHPNSVGETYLKHLTQASKFGAKMILGGLACIIHGIFPFLFTWTGSNTIRCLYEKMVTNRKKCSKV